jgi:hypothetical protein
MTVASGLRTEVVVHARPSLPIRKAPAFLREIPTVLGHTTFHCPSFIDTLYGYRLRKWEDLLEVLYETATALEDPPGTIVFTSLPSVRVLPTFGTLTATTAEEHAAGLDEFTRDFAVAHSGARFAPILTAPPARLG